MAINRSVGRTPVSVAEAHLARVAADGSSRHRHLNALLEASGLNSSRDLADCVHLLCSLHGNQPSLIELAHRHSAEGFARDWLARAAESFERERLFLVRLTSAVGPLPSTGALSRSPPRVLPLARLPPLWATGGPSAASSTAPHRVPAWNPRLPRFLTKRRSSQSSTLGPIRWRASERWVSAASSSCSSTAVCSTCLRPAPKRAATIKERAPAEAGALPSPTLNGITRDQSSRYASS